jgi:nitrate/nitrite-specific signal transduction histidine kinase
MKNRKKIIIDKKFQFKTTFKIIGIVYLLLLIVIAGIVINAVSNNRKLSEIINRQERTVQVQKDILSALFTFSKNMNKKTLQLAHDQVSEDVNYNLTAMKKNSMAVTDIAENNIKLLYGIIIFIIAQAVVLYFILIRTTHRISGPIYHISGYIKDITNGKYPAIRPLRKNDEFREFHELVVKMAESLKKKLKK